MSYRRTSLNTLVGIIDWTAAITVLNSSKGTERHYEFIGEALGPDGLTDEELNAEVISVAPTQAGELYIHIANL